MGQNASHEPLGPDFVRGTNSKNPGTFHPSTVRRSIRKSLRKRRDKRKLKENHEKDSTQDPANAQVEGPSEAHSRKMDKLKRTLSLKKKKEQYVPDAAKPHVWQSDEASVRAGTCNFSVKYLGCVEVFESRGMQVCEEALKVLRTNRRRPIRGILYVSGDGLRVVDDDTKGLIVDQTIEKVSFCAPDRNHERGFSYICRDGTARRWMCHGFVATRDSGERLSHAVGCAFAACLERKQKRDQDSGVTMSFDNATSTFTRMGSFKQMTVTERLSDPQECKPSDNPVPVKKVENPHAIARPHATPQLLQRQGSFRVFNQLNQSSPFKRQLSLRLCDLPSNLERTRSMNKDIENSNITNNNTNNSQPESDNDDLERPQRNRLQSLPNTSIMAPIPETAPLEPRPDAVSEMCQQVSAGLSLLSSFSTDPFAQSGSASLPPMNKDVENLLQEGIDWSSSSKTEADSMSDPSVTSANLSKGEEWLAQLHASPLSLENPPNRTPVPPARKTPGLCQLRSISLGAPSSNGINETNVNGTSNTSNRIKPNDPFDAEWACVAAQNSNPNNPFLQPITKAFEVKM